MSEKKKKNYEFYQQLSPANFIRLSVIVHTITFITSQFIVNMTASALPIGNIYLSVTLFTALPQLLIFAMQAYLLKYQFDWSASRWFKMSFIGWVGMMVTVLSSIFVIGTIDTSSFSVLQLLVITLSLLGTFLVSVMQAVALRRYVSRAWFWIGAMYASLLVQVPLQNMMVSLMPNWIPFWIREGVLSNGINGATLGVFFASTLILLVNLTQRDRQKLVQENDNLLASVDRLQNTDSSNDTTPDYTEHQQDQSLNTLS